MSNNVFEDAPQRIKGSSPANIIVDKVRKQARQLAYDVRYEVKGQFKDGQKTDPAALKRAYMQKLTSKNPPGPVKALAQKMLMGEQYDFAMVESSLPQIFNKVFVEGVGEYVLRVKDPNAGSQYTRSYSTYAAAEAKASELRKKGLRVELATASSSAKKGTYDNKGEGKKDYDGDGKIESGSKEHAGAVHNAIQRKKGGVADGKDTRKEEYVEEVIYETEDERGKKLDVMKGKNKVTINPNVLENATQYFYDQGYNEEDIAIISEGMGYDMFLEFVNEVGSTICLYEDVQGELLTKGGKARKNPKITKSAGTASEISPNKSKETKKPEEKKSSPGQISINYNKKPSPPGQEKIKQGIQTAVRKATSPEAKKKVGGAVKGAANTAARVALSAWKGHQAAMNKKNEGGSIAQQIGSGASRAVSSFLKKGKSHLENYEPTVREGIKAELDALKAQRVEEAMVAAKAAGPSPEEKQQLANKDKMLKQKMMLQKQQMALQRSGRLALNYGEEAGSCMNSKEGEDCPVHGKDDCSMEDPRSMPTKINLAKNKLRAMGLKMSYDMEGDMVEGSSVEDEMKVSQEYFKKLNSRSPEEKKAKADEDAKRRAKNYAMHKRPDPYKSRPGESD